MQAKPWFLGLAVTAALPGVASAAETPQATLAVDVTRTREPISPYVYGQFIEHLGRSIYGGLWAEMLEDRKFYYPVTGRAPAWEMFTPGPRSWDGEGHPYELLMRSPWMVVGDPGAVSMDKQRAFTGEHTPVVRLPGKGAGAGLMQERLGLVEGKRYVGRVVLAGDASATPVRVRVAWGGGASEGQTITVHRLGADYATVPFEITAGGTTDNGRLEIVGHGDGTFRIGTASLMPADNVKGWRRDTFALLRDLDAPIYRWPGGNFVSGYDWKDGIGDRDRRPPRKNPAWTGVEHNDVGIDEFLEFCRELGTDPYIAVNTGLGGVEAAAQEIEYVNGAADTPMGKLRAKNGHPAPYGVKWWGIGNEMYGDWQLGHMPLPEYIKKHNRVVEAMRAVDPAMKPVAVGAVGDWTREMMTHGAGHMELLSEHLYWQDTDDVPSHVAQAVAGIRKVADAHRAYRRDLPSLRGKDIRLALDEWNYWYGPNEYGELGTRYFLQDALGVAAGLHEMYRNSDLFFMANYAQTVNVIGAIKTTKTDAEMEPTGLVLQLYRQRFGTVPVETSGAPAPLDVSAALSQDRGALTVSVVNPTDQAQRLKLAVSGGQVAGAGQQWVITGPGRWAYNRPGVPRQVDIRLADVGTDASVLEVPALSVVLRRLPLAGKP
jgi:alpha-N-arabinofuranosidase